MNATVLVPHNLSKDWLLQIESIRTGFRSLRHSSYKSVEKSLVLLLEHIRMNQNIAMLIEYFTLYFEVSKPKDTTYCEERARAAAPVPCEPFFSLYNAGNAKHVILRTSHRPPRPL